MWLEGQDNIPRPWGGFSTIVANASIWIRAVTGQFPILPTIFPSHTFPGSCHITHCHSPLSLFLYPIFCLFAGPLVRRLAIQRGGGYLEVDSSHEGIAVEGPRVMGALNTMHGERAQRLEGLQRSRRDRPLLGQAGSPAEWANARRPGGPWSMCLSSTCCQLQCPSPPTTAFLPRTSAKNQEMTRITIIEPILHRFFPQFFIADRFPF